MKDQEMIPSGSPVPEIPGETEETMEEVEAGAESTAEAEAPDKVSETEALKKELANLQSVLGRQGKELGDLKKQKAQQPEKEAEPPKDYDSLESDIVERLDAGDIDLKTALRQMNQLASERGAMQATQRIAEQQNQERSNQMIANFKQNNPDFEEVADSGALDEIIANNPLHDQFSAYHEYKRNELSAMLEAKVAEAKEIGKSEGMKVAAESGNAAKVLGKKGDGSRQQQPTKQYQNRGETRAAMMEALKNARS